MTDETVLIIGGGMAGLTCAHYLHQAQQPFLLLEAADHVGGRVKTELFEGFQLDYGFQVYLDAYPEGRAILNLDALALHRFEAGAMIQTPKGAIRIADPLRQPQHLLQTLLAPIGSLADKLTIARLKAQVMCRSLSEIYALPDQPTSSALLDEGFSEQMLSLFWKPFLSGIFLESELQTSRRMLDLVLKYFSHGHATLPARGMKAIPDQLARQLPPEAIRLRSRVTHITNRQVVLDSGEILNADHLVLAASPNQIRHWLGRPTQPMNGVTGVYFTAAMPNPPDSPILWLNATGQGVINHWVNLAAVCPHYAPAGQALYSVNLLDQGKGSPSMETLQAELAQYLQQPASTLRHLKTVQIPEALPTFNPQHWSLQPHSPQIQAGLYIASDAWDSPSLNGAMAAGRRAAEAILTRI